MNLFIDANVLLSFYHLSSDDLEEVSKLSALIEKGEITLWVTEQLQDEYKRNRENKISDALKKLTEQRKKYQFPQFCKDYQEYEELRNLQKEQEKQWSGLLEKVKADISSRSLKADEKITELLAKAEFVDTTPEIIEKARFRMDVRNPPGKDNSLGDSISWECLLGSVPETEDLHFVADDKDFYSALDNDSIKDFLGDEWQAKKASNLNFNRRLSQFFKANFPTIEFASEIEKEDAIDSIVRSGNFHNTHLTIARLEKFTEFSETEINLIARAALENGQVNMIICDDDVWAFYSRILEEYVESIEVEIYRKLQEELDVCKSAVTDT